MIPNTSVGMFIWTCSAEDGFLSPVEFVEFDPVVAPFFANPHSPEPLRLAIGKNTLGAPKIGH
jgi:hypothetical protein